jgi:outer membrane receptor protein involved in Fe transport
MKYILTFLLIAVSISVSAQLPKDLIDKTGEISGLVIDNSTKQPLAYVNIVVKDASKTILTGSITDDKGKFSITKLPLGESVVEIQFIGFKTISKSIKLSAKNQTINLGTIPLLEDASLLKEVVVNAETSTIVQKVDRKVINVGKDLTSAGASASELLNNVPSVSVDSQNGNVSLRGNENVRILVDGKPSNIDAAQLLKQIPSTSIKSIELITNPSAKYNPEGMSGIINIVLHKNANTGFNANINNGVTIGKNISYNGSFDMNYKVNKLNFFTNYGYNNRANDSSGFIKRFDNNSEQTFDFYGKNKSHLIKVGVDFYINDKNTLSAYTNQNINNATNEGQTDILFKSGNFPNIIQNIDSDDESDSQTYNLNYKHEFNKVGQTLEIETNYSTTNNKQLANYYLKTGIPIVESSYVDTTENERNTTNINIDYTDPINDKQKLEVGFESRIRKTDNSYNSTSFNNSFYNYNNNVHSFYTTYSQKFDKLSVQVGARIESYDVEAVLENVKIYEDDYFTLYPSTFFTYEASDKNQYQLSYSKRVDRPGLSQVNPIREWNTPTVTSVGNPELKPQFTHSFEVNYTRKLKDGTITFGTFYRRIEDAINRVLLEDVVDPNKVILTYDNSDSSNAYGIELSSNYKFTKWWSANMSFDLYNKKEKGFSGTTPIEVTNTSWNVRANNTFKLNEKVRLQLFGMYRGANENIQFEVDPMWKIDFGGSWNILNNNGTISARVSDIFNTMNFGFDSVRPYPQTGNFYWESQTAYVGFSYKFGSGKNKAKDRKRRDNNELQGSGGFI